MGYEKRERQIDIRKEVRDDKDSWASLYIFCRGFMYIYTIYIYMYIRHPQAHV